jgi:hypothetical protein
VVSIISSITFGPLQGAGPSVGSGWLCILTGAFGLIWITVNLLMGKGKNVSRWKIVFGLVVFLFFTASGIVQLLAVR